MTIVKPKPVSFDSQNRSFVSYNVVILIDFNIVEQF